MITANDKDFSLEDIQAELSELKGKYDLAAELVNSLKEPLEKLLALKEGDDKELIKTIKSSIREASEKLEHVKQIDFSPLVNLISELSQQNKKVIELLSNQPKPEKPESIAPLITEMIEKQNRIIAAVLDKKEPEIQKPEWDFKIDRTPNGFIQGITAKQK